MGKTPLERDFELSDAVREIARAKLRTFPPCDLCLRRKAVTVVWPNMTQPFFRDRPALHKMLGRASFIHVCNKCYETIKQEAFNGHLEK